MDYDNGSFSTAIMDYDDKGRVPFFSMQLFSKEANVFYFYFNLI